MIAAMKARDEARLSTLRMIEDRAEEARNRLHEAAGRSGRNANPQVPGQAAHRRRRDVPQRRPRGIGRTKKKPSETLIESYLPAAAGEAEIEAAIAAALAETGATSLKQMGIVMKAAQAKLAGKTVDGKALSEKVRSRLQ